MERANKRGGDRVKLVMGHLFRLEVPGNPEFTEPQMQPLNTGALPGNAHNVLSRSRIAFNNGNTPLPEDSSKPHSTSGELLHTRQQAWINVNAAPFQFALRLPHNAEYVATRIVVFNGNATCRQTKWRV